MTVRKQHARGLAQADDPREDHSDARDLKVWVKTLTEITLPVFARTVKGVSGVASQRETSADDLANAIKEDASMAARLLKVSNSALMKTQAGEISTISAAVVIMGFDAVRQLAISLAVVENMSKGDSRDRLTRIMAHSFHAATHAQAFAKHQKDLASEEVFVAGLLLNIGAMTFWSTATTEAKDIEQFIAEGLSPEKAERQVLGFSLQDVSEFLTDEWNLGKLLQQATRKGGDADPRVSFIRFGHELATALEQHGWHSSVTQETMKRISKKLDIPFEDVAELAQQNAEEAAKIASYYGVREVGNFIPHNPDQSNDTVESSEGHLPDLKLHLSLLHQIGKLIEGEPDLSILLKLVLDCVHKGVGTDRALFALLSRDRCSLRATIAVGCDHQNIVDNFVINVGPNIKNLFRLQLDSHKAIYVNEESRAQVEKLITPEIERWVADSPFFSMPIVVNDRPIGLLYADRARSGRNLDEDAFVGFCHLAKQVMAGLSSSTKV